MLSTPLKPKPLAVAVLGVILASVPHYSTAHDYKPPGGYVQTADVAIEIAEAILKPIYGEQLILFERPFSAILTQDRVWVVKGSLAKNHKGGVAEIWISKDNGSVIKVTHGM